jgi:hypothetical protein
MPPALGAPAVAVEVGSWLEQAPTPKHNPSIPRTELRGLQILQSATAKRDVITRSVREHVGERPALTAAALVSDQQVRGSDARKMGRRTIKLLIF